MILISGHFLIQLGEVSDTCIRPPRILGSLPNRHGISATLHCALHYWDFKTRKTWRKEHQAVLNTPTPASCVLAIIEAQNKIVVQNVIGFCTIAQACSIHRHLVETLCRKGESHITHQKGYHFIHLRKSWVWPHEGLTFEDEDSESPVCSVRVSWVQVLNEDLRLVLGQQERMINGANVWNLPVSYDKLGVRYRQWRDALERRVEHLPLTKEDK